MGGAASTHRNAGVATMKAAKPAEDPARGPAVDPAEGECHEAGQPDDTQGAPGEIEAGAAARGPVPPAACRGGGRPDRARSGR